MNHNGMGRAVKGRAPASDPGRTGITWNGWTDVREGRGYPRDYDSWPEGMQKCYEYGRHQAAIVRAVDGVVPAWARNRPMRLNRAALAEATRELNFFTTRHA